ncbi:MAG: phosphotransferase [Bacteroidales bacterium]|nr:phosphotransferase [Bacteroidales bacterium]
MISIKQITDQFKTNGAYRTYMKYGNGTVNETYLVTASRELYILRKFNPKKIDHVPSVVANTLEITNHLKSKEICTLQFIESLEGKYYVIDAEGFYWIMSLYYSGTVTPQQTKNNRMAFQAGKVVGEFHTALSDFPIEKLQETNNESFNLEKKVEEVTKLVNSQEIPVEFSDTILDLLNQGRSLVSLWNLMETNRFPQRLIHGNAKLENMLFNTKEEALCLVDFDTITKGNILFDVGSAACSVAGNACAAEKYDNMIDWKSDFLKEFITGYFTYASGVLSLEERNSLHDAFRLCAYKHTLDTLIIFLSAYNNKPEEFEFSAEFISRYDLFRKLNDCSSDVLDIIRSL